MTNDDFKRFLDEQTRTLGAQMLAANAPLERRLDSMNAHLKELNGRTGKSEERLGRHDERFRTVFEQLRRRSDPPGTDYSKLRTTEPEPSGENRRITMRDLYVALGAIGTIISILKFLGKL